MYLSNTDLLGYRVYGGKLDDLTCFNKVVINTLNGHSYTVAKKDKQFREALKKSDILLPDGEAVVFGAKTLLGSKIQKIAGYDMFTHLLKELNVKHGSCFFLGAQPETLELIDRRLHTDYYNVLVGAYSPPFVHEFSKEESEVMCKVVNMFQPDVLFVGMTAPKQEKWVHQYKDEINVPIICSIGAVFDFYAGTKNRPSEWMINNKLEWFGRFVQEPRRMFHRYFVSTPVIFIDIFKKKYGIRKRLKRKLFPSKYKIHQPELGTSADLDLNAHYNLMEGSSKKEERTKV
ncbi:WecB/TagA/CpsF family glycosyltransferase [Labilibacter marinus]|uniref:WecB/TagA/CpsF family glycosyltransferase n=1 Tax=Labilibacter marinus TaxID=1477105 RepID=UPI000835319D|nr:WecB/TagA/CpsF family glycosyltransferase [Labilibacter marinus]